MKVMDMVGWLIATAHQMLGHSKTAMYLGQDSGDPKACILCLYEAGKATRQDVINRLGIER